MILIADSGSTKTEWGTVEKGQLRQMIRTEGMNPCFRSEEEIGSEIQRALLPQLETQPCEALFFYGAGCLPEKIKPMQDLLIERLRIPTVEVHSDMLGAARGLCQHDPGIVCILGTGSNSCYYNGNQITASVSPLGFILGDEGSGAVLGKLLVGDLLKNRMPAGLKEKFLEQYHLTPAEIIERVYRQPAPNRFLAGLSPFLAQNIDVPPIRELVRNAFRAFLDRNAKQYDYHRHPVHFAGSIAHYYREILETAVADCGMKPGRIVRAPLDGLVAYHQ
jgi:N-acetylglucosamine kinase-like BadF-type ATPase